MSTITVAWWWMLVAFGCVVLTGFICGLVAYNWGWSHAAEDVHGRHVKPDPLAPVAALALLPAPLVPLEPFAGRPNVLYELPAEVEPYNPFKVDLKIPVELARDFGCCEPDEKPDLRDGTSVHMYQRADGSIVAADDPSITTWTRQQAEELDRAIKAMIADTDTFIAGLGGSDR